MFVNAQCRCFFADDANLFINGSNINELESLTNSELAEIAKWLKVNKLSLNINKTHYMNFTTKRKIIPGIIINIEGHIIDEVDSTKFLGIYLDNKLNWKKKFCICVGKSCTRHWFNNKSQKTSKFWLHCIILLYSPTYRTVITSGVLRMQLTYRNWWYSRNKYSNNCWYEA